MNTTPASRSRQALYFLTGMISTGFVLSILVGAILLGGCQASPASPTATPTKTPTPQIILATATPVPQAEVQTPTNVPVATPAPTATPMPPAAETPTAETGIELPTPLPPTVIPTQPPSAVVFDGPQFGSQAFLWWRPDTAERDLRLMKDAGFQWVKQWFAWQDIEGAGRGHYDWSRTDRIVDQVEAAGLNLLVRVSPTEDHQSWMGAPPENADLFAEFAGEVAKRYRGRIHAYQIWNEPNLSSEWGDKHPDPAAYVMLLGKAYRAIKAQDPNAIVITAGMAPTTADIDIAMYDTKFYTQMYEAMGGNSDGYFDMLGVHGAGYASPPELDPALVSSDPKLYNNDPSDPERLRVYSFRHVEDIRRIMERYGDTDKKIAILEFGWTFDNRPNSTYYWYGAGADIDMFVQADYLVRAYQWASEYWPWIGIMSLIYMPDSEWTPNDEKYYWAIMDPSPPGETYWRPAYIELCIYMNAVQGRTCKYDPNK
ncbi:MAG: cellulase family glycosylhydrolase [Chloroflexi bacterium]|nr:cellulase family glycosylhydrolase [Chloroflexota bacterium]